ncbi:MAG: hypothetical protein JXP73_11080 [Deltaproteobacteria bacterium]|nr:hypothetical protein [Deltaproteobacteria bacterium]
MRRAAGLQGLRSFLKVRPNVAPTYSVSDLVAVSLAAAVVAVWAEAAGGSFSLLALLASAAAFFSFYLVGSLLGGWRPLAAGVLFDLPLRLLVGYAAVNTALFALAWLSPLGIVANFAIVLALAALLFVAAKPTREASRDASVALLALGLSLAAATLWCQDSLRPASLQDDAVVFKPWIDGFYHAVHLRIFGAGHGAATIEDFRLAGVPARLYHYGVYLTPAFIKQASGIQSYTAFAGILAPVGVFFTGLGAYALVGSFWGRWPGLAACAALLLLPDGAQQGMRNTFLSYHWLTQMSPSATYGVAIWAVAWLFVMRGCTQGSWLHVLAGWLVGGLLLLYKAHFFIASALLLVLVPPLFFRKPLGLRKRILWAAAAVAAYGATVFAVRNVPGVPLIRFDGSGARDLLGHVGRFTQPGAVRDLVLPRIGLDSSALSNLLLGIPFVLFAALGAFVPLLVVLAVRVRKRTPAPFWILPFVLIANFLAMFLGLALDMRSSTPDELSHRPVIVVYFAVVAWLGGAAGLSLLESKRLARFARPTLVALAVVLLAVPAYFGSGVHQMWAMRSISPPHHIPVGLVRAAEYARDHGGAQDLVQDSQLDRFCVVAALSERKAFVARSMTLIHHNADRVQERADAIEEFMALRDASAIMATARQLGFRWFLLNRGDRVDWPEPIVNRPAFELGGYRLYRF